jgi:aminoglycoside 3-N-acetyltransferase
VSAEPTFDDRPLVTPRTLRHDLAGLGIGSGSVVIVHSSLSSIGWVLGGAESVVRELIRAVGDAGTLVMPAATPRCADPATWLGRSVSPSKLSELRDHLPIFDARTTPTTLGAIPETFRNWPGTNRSTHPVESVSARGPHAERVTDRHPLPFSEGHDGPFGRLFELDCQILLLGVGFDRCTALHYAESLVPSRRTTTVRFPALEDGRRVWKEVPNVADDNGAHFPRIGEEYLQSDGNRREGKVGKAAAMLVPMRELVDFAVGYFERTL